MNIPYNWKYPVKKQRLTGNIKYRLNWRQEVILQVEVELMRGYFLNKDILPDHSSIIWRDALPTDFHYITIYGKTGDRNEK